MKILFTLCFALFFLGTKAQENFEWPIKELDTAREVSYLSEEEKDVILELNKVRSNPAMYAHLSMKWMEVYYSGKLLKVPGKEVYETEEGKTAFLECIEELEKAAPAPILYPSKGMSKACDLLVFDQSATGKTGHRGSGNSSPTDRLANFGDFTGHFGENIHYGDCEPAFVVISLLIDDGVKSRGHRKSILDPSFHFTGVAIGTHKVYGHMCVNTYATAFIDK
jgi:uncharacterized protein YkwD